MYDVEDETYCYPGTSVLKNLAGLRSQSGLDRFEAVMTAQRFEEPLPPGRLTVAHFRAIHRHIFQDVYPWAGRFRTVRMRKGFSPFCYPEHISREMAHLFARLGAAKNLSGLEAPAFAEQAAAFLATLNAIHPFRDGNGRAQTAFLLLIASRAGHPLNMHRFDPEAFRWSMVASFDGDEERLRAQILAVASRF
ncbi:MULTISPECIES: Fic/DOC family protein [unclassified Methylobacterium]|uniref:Fic/DOC family protein n=1 Tax=unclassified Methylobacterium TaxID=2615210 RepID=UPI0037001C7A